MSETGFCQSRQDWDFQNPIPFFETGIETFKNPIPFSRLGSRLLKCWYLFRDWDWDFQNANPFFETGITVIETGIETFNQKSNCKMGLWNQNWSQSFQGSDPFFKTGGGTPALHLDEPNWIIDGFNELILDFLSEIALFLDSTQPHPLNSPKWIHFFWIKIKKNPVNTIVRPNQAQASPGQVAHSNAGLVFSLRLLKIQSLFQDWDRDFQNTNPFIETGIKTFKMSISFSRLGSTGGQKFKDGRHFRFEQICGHLEIPVWN